MVAGYSLLFLAGSSLRREQRYQEHLLLADALVADLRLASNRSPLNALPGVEVLLVDGGEPSQPSLVNAEGSESWLVSRRWLNPANRSQLVEVRQSVTAALQQDRTDQLLLIAAAGGSMLFTAFLLRLVLRRGLVLPLREFSQELNALEVDSLGLRSIDVDQQSHELQPIAAAFNSLQQRLELAWRRERTFVDGVAHELRTPIAVISAHAQRLSDPGSTERVQSAAALIASEALRMGDLVQVLLDFARSDSGRLQLNPVDLDVELFLLDLYERLTVLAPQRLRLASPTVESLPRITVDLQRLQQCLAALVDNALKYSKGLVTLSAELKDEAVVLHVVDAGPGIPAHERSMVVERFSRGQSSIGTRGSGIGLATVTLLIQAMEGDLLIADAPGGGADMQLRFKLSARPPEP